MLVSSVSMLILFLCTGVLTLILRDSSIVFDSQTCSQWRFAGRDASVDSRRLCSVGDYQAWVTARSEKDFSKFAPVLEEWVALVRESSQLVDPSRPAYDVALEEFEKGMTAARLDEVFTQVPLLTFL